jgi:glutathione S-transferase
LTIIYHITFRSDWEDALRHGEYRISTRGKTLEDEGFIHASTSKQVTPVANLIYPEGGDLLVLAIDASRLTSEVRYDHVADQNEPFPHIYGPLNTDAVLRTHRLKRGDDGRFSFSVDDEGT